MLTLLFFFTTAQAGIAVITRDGEKTLTIQSAQAIKQKMNAEKEALKAAATGAAMADHNNETPFVGGSHDMTENAFSQQAESQFDGIGTYAY